MPAFLIVLLNILKYTGIVLGALLAFILILLLVLLVFPFSYRANGSYMNGDIDANGFITFLHLASFKFRYSDRFEGKFKILFFTHYLDEDKVKKEKSKKSKKKKEDSEPKNLLIEDYESDEYKKLRAEHSEEDFKTESKKIAHTEDDSNKKSKNDKIYVKIKKYLKILKTDEFKEAFSMVKEHAFKILKALLPRRFKVDAKVSFDDPSVTGEVLMIAGMLYPLFEDKVTVEGDFEAGPNIEVYGKVNGHFNLAYLLIHACKIYFNKNIRKIIKLFEGV